MATNSASFAVLAALGAAACGSNAERPRQDGPAEAISEIVVARVSADLREPDPSASYWRQAARGSITLTAQPMVTPRPEKTLTDQVAVQAVHDGKTIAFRLSWADPERSEAGRLGEFSDALAVEFPIADVNQTPVMMGAKGFPVHIFHWRAQYQRDKEKGKPQMASLYPNMAIDMYPMDFKDAPGGTESDRESFSPGRAEGNPQSYAKNGVDEIIAEGFATSAVQEGHSSAAHAEWKDGRWTLVISRPLAVAGGSVIKPGADSSIAFAAWQGGQGEVGSRKSVTMFWIPLRVK